jgi:DNA-binding transcriptional LysR family regulator
MEVAVDTTSYLHAAAALRSGVCAAVLPSIALAEFPADRTVTWPLTALKLERDPVSLMWNQRNASTRPAVATLAEAMPGILSFC